MATKLLPIFEALQGEHGKAVSKLDHDAQEISLLKDDRLLRLGRVGTRGGIERWGDHEIGAYLISSSCDPNGKPGVCYGQSPDTDGTAYEFHFRKDGMRQNDSKRVSPKGAEGVIRPLLLGAHILRSDVGLEMWRLCRSWRTEPNEADSFAALVARWQHDIKHGQNLGTVTEHLLRRAERPA